MDRHLQRSNSITISIRLSRQFVLFMRWPKKCLTTMNCLCHSNSQWNYDICFKGLQTRTKWRVFVHQNIKKGKIFETLFIFIWCCWMAVKRAIFVAYKWNLGYSKLFFAFHTHATNSCCFPFTYQFNQLFTITKNTYTFLR